MDGVSNCGEVKKDRSRNDGENVNEKSEQDEWVDVEPEPSCHYSESSDEQVAGISNMQDTSDDDEVIKTKSQSDEESLDENSEQDEWDDEESEYSYHDSENSDEEVKNTSNTRGDKHKSEEKHICSYASNSSKRDSSTNDSNKNNNNKSSFRYKEICERCGSEQHAPIKSCQVASEYSSLLLPVRTWPLESVLPSIAQREQECGFRFRHFKMAVGETKKILRRRGWNVSLAASDAKLCPSSSNQKRTEIINGGPTNCYGRLGERYQKFMEMTIREANIAASSLSRHHHHHRRRHHPKPTVPTSVVETSEGTEAIATEKATSTSQCGICLDEFRNEELIPLERCGHSFCSSCWKNYLESVFRDSPDSYTYPQVQCPMNWCSEVVTEPHVRRFGRELVKKFRRHYLQPFVASNSRYLRWCPTPNCNRIAIFNSFSKVVRSGNPLAAAKGATVFCGPDGCGTRFCFRCGGTPHTGLCDPKADAPATEHSIISTTQEAHPRIQFCPTCSIPIEKSGGCDDIVCTMCKTEFRWSGQHVTKRTVSDEKPERNIVDQMKAITLDYVYIALNDIKYIGGRRGFYIDYNNGIVLAQRTRQDLLFDIQRQIRNRGEICANPQIITAAEKQELQETRAYECQSLANRFRTESEIHSATDTDFIEDANRLLLACRRVLKYSYCYIFHATRENDAFDYGGLLVNHSSRHFDLFYHQQEQLEQFTDKLSEITKSAITYADRKRVIDLVSTSRVS